MRSINVTSIMTQSLAIFVKTHYKSLTHILMTPTNLALANDVPVAPATQTPHLELVEETDLQKLVDSFVISIDRMLLAEEGNGLVYQGEHFPKDRIWDSCLGAFQSRHEYMENMFEKGSAESRNYVAKNYYGSGLSEIILKVINNPKLAELERARDLLREV